MRFFIKSSYDLVTEMALNESNFYFRGKRQIGAKVTLGICFICGECCDSKTDICSDCRTRFPIKNKRIKNDYAIRKTRKMK